MFIGGSLFSRPGDEGFIVNHIDTLTFADSVGCSSISRYTNDFTYICDCIENLSALTQDVKSQSKGSFTSIHMHLACNARKHLECQWQSWRSCIVSGDTNLGSLTTCTCSRS